MSLLGKIGEHTLMRIIPNSSAEMGCFDLNTAETQLIESLQTLAQYGMSNPKAISEFVIGSYEMALSSMTVELQGIRDSVVQPNFSTIDTAIDAYERTYENRKEERQRLNDSLDNMSTSLRNLFAEVEKCVVETERIEGLSDTQKRMSFLNKLTTKTDNNNILARRCMDAIVVGMTYAQQIGERLGAGYVDRLNRDFNRFVERLLSGNRCLLMHDYDPSESEYWLTVPQGVREMIASGKAEDIKVEIDYDNIDFS